MGKEKISYIEYIRVFAAVAVVFLHIVMTLPNNYTVEELGVFNYAVFSGCYMFVKWAVPCFIMVTGALLLNPEKEIDIKKTAGYILRMLKVLLTFGVVYALMELVFSEKTVNIMMLPKAILNTMEGKTWDHMWYIYALIPIYIIMLPLKDFIRAQNRSTLRIFIIALIIGNFAIPTINTICGTNIKILTPFGDYITYFLIGYYISTIPKESLICKKSILISGGGIATLAMAALEVYSLTAYGKAAAINHSSGEMLTLIQSVSVFMLVRILFENSKISNAMKTISVCSFGIYLIHPFWINLIYKVFKITPLSMPIGAGIAVLFAVVFALSFCTAFVMRRIPVIKRII